MCGTRAQYTCVCQKIIHGVASPPVWLLGLSSGVRLAVSASLSRLTGPVIISCIGGNVCHGTFVEIREHLFRVHSEDRIHVVSLIQ